MAGKTRRAGMVKSRRTRKVFKGKSLVRKAIKRARRSNFQRAVLKVIKGQSETKMAYYANSSSALVRYNSGIDTVADMTQILPSITTGVNENERIGTRIRTQGFNVRGVLKFDPATSALSPSTAVAVRLMVVSIKNRPSLDSATATATVLNQLLKKGGTQTAFTGILSDITAPINTDVFTCHYNKVMYLKQDAVYINGSTPTNAWLSSDISKLTRFFNINIRCKNKDLKYDDGVNSGLYPTNWYPFLIAGYCYLDGSAPDVISTKLGIEFTSTLKFEDN